MQRGARKHVGVGARSVRVHWYVVGKSFSKCVCEMERPVYLKLVQGGIHPIFEQTIGICISEKGVRNVQKRNS